MQYCTLDSQYFTHANLVLVKMNLFSHRHSIKQNSNVIKICYLVIILLTINIQTLKKNSVLRDETDSKLFTKKSGTKIK